VNKRHGHTIGLNLGRDVDGPPITIDGVGFSRVGKIALSANPVTGVSSVTVEFFAAHVTGVGDSFIPSAYEAELDSWPADAIFSKGAAGKHS